MYILIKQIEAQRELLKMSQQDTAKACGISKSYYCEIVNGIKTGIKADLLEKMGAAVGLRLVWAIKNT